MRSLLLKQKRIIITVLVLAFLLSGCSMPGSGKNTVPGQNTPASNQAPAASNNSGESANLAEMLAKQEEMKKFADMDEIKAFLEERSQSLGYAGYKGMMTDGAWGAMAEESLSAPSPARKDALSTQSAAGSAINFSQTNIQVEGVDEADIVKTDGDYIYAISGSSLYIVDAVPGKDASVLSKIQFKSMPSELYISKNRMIVIGHDYNISQAAIYKKFIRKSAYSFLKVFDITDRKDPKQLRDLDFEGNYTDSRMIGDYVYLVTQTYAQYLEDELPIPRIIDEGKELSTDKNTKPCNCPDVYYFDIPSNYFNYLSVAAVNISDKEERIGSNVFLLSQNQNLYVSQKNLYLTYTKYLDEYSLMMDIMQEIVLPKLSAKDQERIAKIRQADKLILTKAEKQAKITSIVEKYVESRTDGEQDDLRKKAEKAVKQKYEDISKELEKTIIHKIAIDKNKLELKGSGEVTGYALNQFSMDEKDGYFRIATTKNRSWSSLASAIYDEEGVKDQNVSYSNLYVLDENLKQVGALEKLAENEQIYSVRFMQNKAYMVTFKQTDPLFVIDLSTPTNPKVLGKLKIPGFSNYLHPYDENTLIGIGKETSENQWGGVNAKGLKISLFDVSDIANPKEAAKYELGESGSNSEALSDHKAFLFSREKELLAIPVHLTQKTAGNDYARYVFSGAAVFKITRNSIDLKGKIEHSDSNIENSNVKERYYYNSNPVRRCLYIGDDLYSVSNQFIKINQLSDLSEVKKLELSENLSGAGDDFEAFK